MESEKTPLIEFKLNSIMLDQFAIFEASFIEHDAIQLRTNTELKVDTSSRQLGVFMTYEFLQQEKHIIKLQVSCHFGIEPAAWDQLLDGNSIRFPNDFITHLSIITIGTSRGILFAKLEGTSCSKLLLPTLNTKAILGTEDFVFRWD